MKLLHILLSGLVAAAPLGAESRAQKMPHPDVFLVTIDTLRADHVHCYGYEPIQTPALDGLARDGIRFANAFTPSPITNTSHASILTGLLPGSHGVTDFAVPLSATHPTIAELLKKQSYHTAAFIGAVILDSKTDGADKCGGVVRLLFQQLGDGRMRCRQRHRKISYAM